VTLTNAGNIFRGPVNVSGTNSTNGSSLVTASSSQTTDLVTQLESNILPPQASGQSQSLNPSTTITVAPGFGTNSGIISQGGGSAQSVSTGNSSSSGSGNKLAENVVTLTVGGTGSLQIINGGVRLPDSVASPNEGPSEVIKLNQGLTK
jgi:hypothetical protein